MTYKQIKLQKKAIRRLKKLYYTHKRELEHAELVFVCKTIWKNACKEILEKNERLEIKRLAKKYKVKLKQKESDE